MGAANSGSDVTIKRKSGNVAQNEATGVEAQSWTHILDSAARFSAFGGGGVGREKPLNPGGVVWEQADRTLSLPAAVTGLVDGDMVEVVAGEIAGTYWRILETARHDQMTAFRVPVVQVDRPEGW
jgi:hypothetical protein